MLLKVNLLGKAGVASIFLASKRFLTGVDSEMINEVMPLAKVKAALGVIALENRDHTVSFWVLELVHAILLCLGQLRFHLQLVSIERVSVLHRDLDALRNQSLEVFSR